jgi:hypothetical protein
MKEKDDAYMAMGGAAALISLLWIVGLLFYWSDFIK